MVSLKGIMTMHCDLVCSLTGESYAVDQLQGLSRAGKPLLARYDLAAVARRVTPEILRRRAIHSMWRFHECLPVDDPAQAVSLGEGGTPLIPGRPVGPFAPFSDLWIKDEGGNPTQSFKARGMSAAITRALALGVRTVALPSAGNAAGAATAYAARAGLRCVVFLPQDTPPANILEAVCGGAEVYLVNGLINDCGRLCRLACDRFGWFDLSTLKEPFRLEGKKTMGYELAFDLATARQTHDLQIPEVVIYPTGGGTGLVGIWKALQEMEELGWIGPRRPRMVVVQAEGCAPIVRAFRQGASAAPPFPNAATQAAGLRVPVAVGDFLMLDILRQSQGTALTITDQEMLQGVSELARYQGIHAAPEGGAVWMATRRLHEMGWLRADQTILLINTGAAVKYNHLLTSDGCRHLDQHAPDVLDQIGG
jgi:threonine synthase